MDHDKLCKDILKFDSRVRFTGVCDETGEIRFGGQREGVKNLLTPEETKKSNLQADNAKSRQKSLLLAEKNSVFYQFLIITLAAYMSHIAYDVFVDTRANFPLLAPFSFSDDFILQVYALPIEGAAILLDYSWFSISEKKRSIPITAT